MSLWRCTRIVEAFIDNSFAIQRSSTKCDARVEARCAFGTVFGNCEIVFFSSIKFIHHRRIDEVLYYSLEIWIGVGAYFPFIFIFSFIFNCLRSFGRRSWIVSIPGAGKFAVLHSLKISGSSSLVKRARRTSPSLLPDVYRSLKISFFWACFFRKISPFNKHIYIWS